MSQHAATTNPTTSLFQSPQGVIDRICPAVRLHGGDLELPQITAGDVARMRLHGDFMGCHSSAVTLRAGIERCSQLQVPEVVDVKQVQ